MARSVSDHLRLLGTLYLVRFFAVACSLPSMEGCIAKDPNRIRAMSQTRSGRLCCRICCCAVRTAHSADTICARYSRRYAMWRGLVASDVFCRVSSGCRTKLRLGRTLPPSRQRLRTPGHHPQGTPPARLRYTHATEPGKDSQLKFLTASSERF